MAPPRWTPDSAARLVAVLLAQDRRRCEGEQTRHGAQTRYAVVSIALFVLAVLALPLGLRGVRPDSPVLLYLLFAAPMLAGASGATIRAVFTPVWDRQVIAAVALGLIAGGVSLLLFLVAQLPGTPDLLTAARKLADEQARGLLLFTIPVGFIAGLTFDRVYPKLAKANVVTLDGVDQR